MKKFLWIICIVVTYSINGIEHDIGAACCHLYDSCGLANNILIEAFPSRMDIEPYQDVTNSYLKEIRFYLSSYEINHQDASLIKAEKYFEQWIHTQNRYIADLESELDPIEYQALEQKVHAMHEELAREFHIISISQKLAKWFSKHSTDILKEELNSDNPYKNETAYVRQSSGLIPFEQNCKEKRRKNIQEGLKKFFGLDYEKDLTIGFVGTGGGYRAMILTTGYLKALEDVGLLDATMYISSLSGSTWFLIPWTFARESISSYQHRLLDKIRNDWFDITGLQTLMCSDPGVLVNSIIWPKFIFDQSMSSVDLYGALLAMVLFSEYDDHRHHVHLADQMAIVEDGAMPYPIYTSVSMHRFENESRYSWYEFNPAEVRNLDLDAYIPSWAFDCPFDHGKTVEIAPQQSFGYLMGIFGSAYTVNFRDMNRLFYEQVDNSPSWFHPIERIKYKVTKRIVQLMSYMPHIGKHRFSPAQINNPFKACNHEYIPEWLSERNELTFVDAGISYNIPIRPLLRAARQVDVIIIGESSGNVEEARELHLMFEDIHNCYGYNYIRVNDETEKTLGLYHDPTNKQAPKIIYVNFLDDQSLIEQMAEEPDFRPLIIHNDLLSFDASKCLEDDYCDTFNFGYSEQQFKQLAGIAEFNMKVHLDTIRAFMMS